MKFLIYSCLVGFGAGEVAKHHSLLGVCFFGGSALVALWLRPSVERADVEIDLSSLE